MACAHAFFEPINFVQLEAREVEAPFKPMIADPYDTSNFEEFEDDDEDDDDEVSYNRTKSFVSKLPSAGQFPGFVYTDGWVFSSGTETDMRPSC